MIRNSCIRIETEKFPTLEGEKDELVNDNMYGKALCQYLQEKLPAAGINVSYYGCEDWGWWLDVVDDEFKMGLCIYSHPDAKGNPEAYAVLPSIRRDKRWYWSKFRAVDVSDDVLRIIDALDALFRQDDEINKVSRHDDFPF